MIIYKDEAGNTIRKDKDGRIGVYNKSGKLVKTKGARLFLRRKKPREALQKHFGSARLVFLKPQQE